jgi:hypothetical protein
LRQISIVVYDYLNKKKLQQGKQMGKFLTVITAVLLTGTASATGVDFEDVAVPTGYNNIVTYPAGVTSNGFSFTASHMHLINDSFDSYNGTTWLGIDESLTTMQAVDDSIFSLHQLDISEFFTLDMGPAMNVTIQGNGGSNPSLYFTTDGIYYDEDHPEIASFETVLFSAEWSNLSSVTFSTEEENNIALDNIIVSAVPIPAAIWLFGSALAGLGWMRRRKTA